MLTSFAPVDTNSTRDIFAPLLLDTDEDKLSGERTIDPTDVDPEASVVPIVIGAVERGSFLPSPLRLEGESVRFPMHVEQAVLQAEHVFYGSGPAGLAAASASCWRDMRINPSVQALESCHAFDLASADLVEGVSDFAPFVVRTRLRAHRDMLPVAIAGEADILVRSEQVAALVSAMDAH